ncbi:MAG: DUF2497 domain-containing protein [Pseudomonadota bacterium]
MTNAQPEPSMEEILASIRRIISEDEEEHPGVDRSGLDTPQSVGSPTAEHQADDQGAADQNAEDDAPEVSEQDAALTRMLDMAEARRSGSADHGEQNATQNGPSLVDFSPPDEGEETHDGDNQDDEIIAVAEPADPSADHDQAHDELSTEDVKMVKQQAAAVQDTSDDIVDSTTAKAASAAFGSLTRSVRMADGDGQTLEAVVTEMMRPMVKEWLDTNLSRIVEEKVEYEVQRLARRG